MLENRYEKFNRIILGIDSIFRTIKTSRKTILALVLAALSLTTTGLAFAAASYDRDDSQSRLEDILKTVGKGWQLKSNGGLLYIHPEDKRYWISLSGVLRFDETYFSGSARDRAPYPPATPTGSRGPGFQSGAYLRKAEVDIVGGIGPDWNYTVGLEFGGGRNGSHFSFADTWLAYSGFCENVELFVGRHSGNWFGLENSTSTSWYPFLERSTQANAFYPGDGIGLLVDAWWADGGFTALALQPNQDVRVSSRSDRWLGLTAITYAPIHESGNVWHFGLSLAYHDHDGTAISNALSSYPSARARNVERSVNTGSLLVQRIKQANIEAARQWGPLLVQGEYSQAYLNSAGTTGRGQFNGWSFIGQYMLTGEVHDYDVRDGNFGGIQVCSPYGAFEVAGRYDFVNLNNKNIRGGAQHDVTLGLNWYVNNNVRVAFNYINANILPPSYAPKRHLDIFAARLQVKFK